MLHDLSLSSDFFLTPLLAVCSMLAVTSIPRMLVSHRALIHNVTCTNIIYLVYDWRLVADCCYMCDPWYAEALYIYSQIVQTS